MELNSTYYPNNQRVIAGTATLYQSDCVLLCDTSLAAVSFTLLEIPSDYWETTWKLYVVDNSGNSATNHITINAPIGFTINGASSLVINSNGGVCVVTVSSNTKFLGILSYTTGGGGNIAVLSDGTPVTSAATSFDFSPAFNVTAVGGAVSVGVSDSGWLDLLGFTFLASYDRRPQFRVVGKQVFFRGNIIVPLTSTLNGTTIIPMTTSSTGAFYTQQKVPYVLTGSSNNDACSIDTNGSIAFHRGFNIFPAPYDNESLYLLDSTYIFDNKIIARNVETSDTGNLNLTTVVSVGISSLYAGNANVLYMQAYKDYELSPYVGDPTKGLGTGGARHIISKVLNGQKVPDYRTMASPLTSATASADNTQTSFVQNFSLTTANTIQFSVDPSDESQLGGFQCVIDGLIGWFI